MVDVESGVTGMDEDVAKLLRKVQKPVFLVINKVDIAPYVGVDLNALKKEAEDIRGNSAVAYTNCRSGEGVEDVLGAIKRHVLLEDK